jgi:metal-sulfur cluster biosynthetic enzyme
MSETNRGRNMDERVLQALRQVIDPELRVNIVDLGLVYSAEMHDGRVQVAMTLTTSRCPLAGQITDMAEAAIWKDVTGLQSVEIRLVWSPPWRPAMMSSEVKEQLGWV